MHRGALITRTELLSEFHLKGIQMLGQLGRGGGGVRVRLRVRMRIGIRIRMRR